MKDGEVGSTHSHLRPGGRPIRLIGRPPFFIRAVERASLPRAGRALRPSFFRRARENSAVVRYSPRSMGRPKHSEVRKRSAVHNAQAPRWRAVALVGAAAFAVKLAVLLQLWSHPLLQPRGELDTAYYIQLAQRVAAEGLLAPVESFVVSPLYVYFLAAVFGVGLPVFAAQLIQVALGTAAVVLLHETARHWFGDRAAIVAATFAILTGLFTFNEVLILQSALDPFLVSAALYGLTRVSAGGGWPSFAGTGMLLGLLSLNRPNALVFALTAAAGVAIHQWRDNADSDGRLARPLSWRLGYAALLVSSLLGGLALNAARNYALSGDGVVIASHGGLNFYIGNHDRADGTYTPVPGITPSIAGQATDAKRVAESRAGHSLSPGEVSSYFAWEAVDWITRHPADALGLTARKAAILLNAVDVPLNHSLAFYAREPGSLLRLLAVGPWLLLPLGLVGLAWPALRVNRRGFWLWASFVPVYGASVVIFFVSDRYRMPLFVPLCATAGAAAVGLFDLIRARQWAALRWPAAGLAALSLVALSDLGLDNGIGFEQTRRAILLVEEGAIDEARRYVTEIAPRHSHPGVLQFRVGEALAGVGRYAEAAALFEGAMAVDGPQPAIRLGLGDALLEGGESGKAVGHLEAAFDAGFQPEVSGPLLVRALVLTGRGDEAARLLPRIPDSAASGPAAGDLALDLGTLALEQGAASEAIRWTRMAATALPDSAEAQEKLGLALFLTGDPQSAVHFLERACALDRQSASAHLNLAAVYAALGRFDDARRLANEAGRLDPAEPRVKALLNALPR